MENEHVINGLLRRRQEVADKLDAAQGQVRQLVLDIDALDATIRIFQPDLAIGVVRVRPTPRRHTAYQGESSRMLLNLLREAPGPIVTRELVRLVMEARGLNTADRVMAETMRQRVSSSLRGLRDRGRVTSGPGRGASVEWRVAG